MMLLVLSLSLVMVGVKSSLVLLHLQVLIACARHESAAKEANRRLRVMHEFHTQRLLRVETSGRGRPIVEFALLTGH